MIDIPVSASSRTTVQAVRQASQLIEAAAARVNSGLRVSSPSEGASAFFDGAALTARATALLKAKDKLTDAATVTGSTVAKIDEITTLLASAKTSATAAKGGAVAGGVATTSTGNIVTTAASLVTGTVAGVADGDAFTITHDGTTTTITNTTGTTFTSLAAQITAVTGLTATVADGTALVITASDGKSITITDSVNTLSASLGVASSSNGTVATNATRLAAEQQFNLALTQISALIGNSTFLGKNLLSSSPDSLTVALNENGGNLYTVTGVDSSLSGLNLTSVTEGQGFATDTLITASIAQIDTATSALSRTRSAVDSGGSIINSHLSYITDLVTIVQDGASKLVDANLSAENANLLALKTRHNLSVTGVGLFFKDGTILTSLLQVT